MAPRYAIYAAPEPGSALWRFGSEVIGYDAAAGANVPFPPGASFERAEWRDWTAEPRRYGFHGTLKAPFALTNGRAEPDLLAAASAFAEAREAVTIPALAVALLGEFTALVPAGPSPALDALAAECVRAFEPFRAPLSAADLARRLAMPLSPRQRDQLDRWGYPYVFADFRFHMTLTGRLPEAAREPVRAALAERYRALAPGFRVASLAVFRQDDRAARFRVVARIPFGR